jgi:carbon-monoxide dehydrogenase large subunit
MFSDQGEGGLRKGTPVRGKGIFAPSPAIAWDEKTGRTPKMFNWYQYTACGIDLKVNTETGEIKICNAVIAADMGFPINPKICEGQLEGGLCMAIGSSILEEYIYKNGLMLNSSYGNYRVPTFEEMPFKKDIKILFAPDPLYDGPWGAKGIGEGAMIAVAAAIGNAIHNAIGIRVRDLPLTPERVLSLINQKRNEEKNETQFRD